LFCLLCRADQAKQAVERFPFMSADTNIGCRIWNALAHLQLGDPEPARTFLQENSSGMDLNAYPNLWVAEIRLHLHELQQRLSEWESMNATAAAP
jgi:hypothetical protein